MLIKAGYNFLSSQSFPVLAWILFHTDFIEKTPSNIDPINQNDKFRYWWGTFATFRNCKPAKDLIRPQIEDLHLSQIYKTEEFNDDLPFPNDEILSQACMEDGEQYDNAEMAQAIM